ncbi:MAG: MFS transporter [Planctomycetota bacterium]
MRTVLAAIAFFGILTAYFLLRPWREAMGLEGGVSSVSRLFLITALVTLALQPIYGMLVNRVSRRRLAPAILLGAAMCLVGFAWVPQALDAGASDATRRLVGQAFYVWLSVFNLFAVSVFWQLMVDTHPLDASKRHFGPISIGGTLGAAIGSAITMRYAIVLGPRASFLIAAALLAVAAIVLTMYARRSLVSPRGSESRRPPPWQGLADVLRQPYLLAIVGYLAIYPVLSTFWYFTKLGLIESAIVGTAERAAFLGRVELIAQVATLVVQAVVLGPVLRRLGTGLALAALPVAFALGFLVLGLELLPALALVALLDAGRRVANNGLAKPARETLFTVLPRDQRYKAKNVLDTFIYRASDAAGSLAWRAGVGSLPVAGLATVAVACCAAWMCVGIGLGRAQARRAHAQ